jgi:hypothetical protein
MPGIQVGQDLDMNANSVTELAPGVAGTDAVNLNQLNAIAPQGFSATIGDGAASTFNVVHSLGTTDVMAQVYEVASGDAWLTEVSTSGVNAVDVTFGFVPTAGQFRVQVIPVP